MVTISIADPDGAGTKIAVDTRWYAEKDKTLDQLFVSHHPIVGGWKQAINTFQPEWSPESHGLGARPYRHRNRPQRTGRPGECGAR